MRTNGFFITHTFTKKIDTCDPFYIYFFSDVHKYSRLHSSEKWGRFLEIAKRDKSAVFIGVGDYTEIGSTKERKAIATMLRESHEDMGAAIDRMLLTQCEGFCADVEFMRGRIIGLIGGNHDAQFQSGIYMSQKICDMLGTKFLGVQAHVRLVVDCNGKRSSVEIGLHHGKGGGTDGNQINKVEDLSRLMEADIYAMGDSHGRHIASDSRYYLGRPRRTGEIESIQRDKVYMRTGSYLLCSAPSKQAYTTDMALKPASLGSVRVRVTPSRNHETVDGKKRETFSLELTPEFV